ncbi:HEAT repeat domain-containing protein [Microcoleus sp. T3_D1]|uniref:HEAT repeat domain-containing protein n=1 Tax=Microcoleus sp. T3_D1 TaxID=3055427 RepID=UPI002FD3771E
MSTLTQALNRILEYLEKHKPKAVSLLQPGLSDSEIEELVKDLPAQFPEELYELYKWKNGSAYDAWNVSGDSPELEHVAYIFNKFSFYPLEVAIGNYRPKLIDYRRWKDIHSSSWLEIFFCYIGEVGGFVFVDDSQETSQIIFAYHKDTEDITQKYTSLTSMMTTIAECYETGAYSVTKHEDCTVTVVNDYQKAHQIWCEHNSEIVDSLLEKLQPELSLQSLTDIAADLMKLKDPRTVKPLIRVLEKPALTDDDLGIQALAARILGELGDAGAVEILINALKNDNWMTQYWAAVSLGQIKDERATYPLIEALQNSENEVRHMAVWALGEIGDLRAADTLIDALRDSDGRVKQAASQAWDKLAAKFPELDEEIPF